jgi:hypothetical protein
LFKKGKVPSRSGWLFSQSYLARAEGSLGLLKSLAQVADSLFVILCLQEQLVFARLEAAHLFFELGDSLLQPLLVRVETVREEGEAGIDCRRSSARDARREAPAQR